MATHAGTVKDAGHEVLYRPEVQSRHSRPRSSSGSRPKSPRLHHLSLLPGAQSHPYVHRHEVDAHLAAIRAGAPSPLRRSIDKAQHAEAQRGEYHLWYPASNRSKPHTDTDSARQAH
ncbi:hypothetical protein HBI42_226120 [Parastagonospora nodorum]|nr:hypothetical protein HBI47_240280 [Parastagonospora nodorum]KAH6201461.1 hypothetical protein HBI43_218900 [Parastagonospora nodorum]KAH6242922.1 hypothetical protein HBI42_226120 [Parastagonospora nodorum]